MFQEQEGRCWARIPLRRPEQGVKGTRNVSFSRDRAAVKWDLLRARVPALLLPKEEQDATPWAVADEAAATPVGGRVLGLRDDLPGV